MSDVFTKYEELWSTLERDDCDLCFAPPQMAPLVRERCLSYKYNIFTSSKRALSLPHHLVLRVALFLPTHHCMMHSVNGLKDFIDTKAQRERYVRYANIIPRLISSALLYQDPLYDVVDSGFTLSLGNIPLYDPFKPHEGQEHHWCRLDFYRGIYFMKSDDAFKFINPNVFEESDEYMSLEENDDGTDAIWLLPETAPLHWLQHPRLLLLQWRGKIDWLRHAGRLNYTLSLPGTLSSTYLPLDYKSLDVSGT